MRIRHGAVTAVWSMVGGAHTKPRALRPGRPRTEKSCGPDARGSGVKSCGDAAARPGPHIDRPQGDGGNSATLPEESTKDTVKTIRAGKAGRPASPVVHPVCNSLYTDSGAAGARPSLRPPATKGAIDRAKLGQNAPREREDMSAMKTDGEHKPVPHIRHCKRSEAIQNLSAEAVWIASLRSQ